MPSGTEDQPHASLEPSDGVETHLYLLTLWCEGGDRWRAALRPVGGGVRLGFAGLEQLAAYLLRLDEGGGLAQ